MIFRPPFRYQGSEACTPAYGGCRCACHRIPNVKHCVPCCYPPLKTPREDDAQPLRGSGKLGHP